MKTGYYIVSIVVIMVLGFPPELSAQEIVPLKISFDSRGPEGIPPKNISGHLYVDVAQTIKDQ